jgi:hypothetical protein
VAIASAIPIVWAATGALSVIACAAPPKPALASSASAVE